jgi:hypothetical protein
MDADKARADLTGGCQCGAVRYRLEAAPRGSNLRHCRMRRKAGAGHAALRNPRHHHHET